MEKGSIENKNNASLKFIICSMIGIFFFFVTINYNGSSKAPMVHIMGIIQGAIGYPAQFVFVMVSCIAVLGASLYCKFGTNVPSFLKDVYKKDSAFSYFTYTTAVIFSIMVVFKIGPSQVLEPGIGDMSMEIASDSFAAIMVAGTLVAFVTEFGLLEFVGKMLEPLMRRIYNVPGKSAVDALSSFVIAPAAGVMITNDLYHKTVYTAKEAVSITTNFSIASLGGFAFLSAIAGIADLYTEVVIAAFIATFIAAAIMIRIPPISKKSNLYFNGVEQTEGQRIPENYTRNTLSCAIKDGIDRAGETRMTVFTKQFKASFMFGIKVNAFIVSLSVLCPLIANYTPIVSWIGIPMVPILKILGIADAETIAASSLVGIFALSLPATLIKGKAIAAASAFFIVVLSTTQIIFFTESANAMLESDIPVNFWDLVKIFFLRTAILLPIVAFLTHIML